MEEHQSDTDMGSLPATLSEAIGVANKMEFDAAGKARILQALGWVYPEKFG